MRLFSLCLVSVVMVSITTTTKVVEAQFFSDFYYPFGQEGTNFGGGGDIRGANNGHSVQQQQHASNLDATDNVYKYVVNGKLDNNNNFADNAYLQQTPVESSSNQGTLRYRKRNPTISISAPIEVLRKTWDLDQLRKQIQRNRAFLNGLS